ncbi:MAG TPA: hypothetical protein DIT98_01375, partial [Verrucomicrobiales bacterium]|nr:hypothetical protein [Verrucomicrobiales bacterium]
MDKAIQQDPAPRPTRTDAQDNLPMNNQPFRSFYEISGEAIMLISERHFMECNPACLNLFQASSLEAWRCLHLADILPEKQSDGIFSWEVLEQCMA